MNIFGANTEVWRIPRSEADVLAAALALGFAMPPACVEGVVANLAVLAGHAATLRGEADRA